MNTLSVVVITFNEEKKIGACLESVKSIADEIVVVDSNSSDTTETICRQYGAKFVTQKWLGYAEQKNLADKLATCDLILSIDADEALSDTLRQSIMDLKAREIADNEVFSMNRLNNFCGKWIKRCGLYPDNKVRIWKRGFAEWKGLIHETLLFQIQPRTTKLEGDLLHYSFDTRDEFVKQQFHFAALSGQKYHDEGKKSWFPNIIISPLVCFIRTYLVKGGFLEGRDGFFICRTEAQATRHKYKTLKDLQNKKSQP